MQLLYPDGTADLLPLLHPILPVETSQTQGAKVRGASVSSMEQKIREVLKKAEKPLKGEAIALRAKVSYGGRIRTLLAEMLKRKSGEEGRLIHGPQGGYWLADRSFPKEG